MLSQGERAAQETPGETINEDGRRVHHALKRPMKKSRNASMLLVDVENGTKHATVQPTVEHVRNATGQTILQTCVAGDNVEQQGTKASTY